MSTARPTVGKASASWSSTVTLPVALTLASTTPRLTVTVVGGGGWGFDPMVLKLPTSRVRAVNPSTPCMSLVRIIGVPLSVALERRAPGPKARGQTVMCSLHGSPAARLGALPASPRTQQRLPSLDRRVPASPLLPPRKSSTSTDRLSNNPYFTTFLHSCLFRGVF